MSDVFAMLFMLKVSKYKYMVLKVLYLFVYFCLFCFNFKNINKGYCMLEYWVSLSNWKKIKLVISLICLILVVVFSFQNWEAGDLKLVFFSIRIPITLLIGISLFIGYSLALVYNHKKIIDKDQQIKELKSRLKDFMTDKKDML